MGGCSSREKEKPTTFTKEEKLKLKSLYARVSSAGDNPDLNSNLFEALFHENHSFGKRLLNFMRVYSENKGISYDIFQDIAEILIKDSFEGYKEDYSTFDKMEILAVINIGQKIKKKEELINLEITYIEAIQYVKDFLQMFNLERINSQIDEFAVVSLLNNVFDQNIVQMKWGKFLMSLKEQLLFLNNLIKSFFSHKLLETLPPFKLPVLSKPSYLLNNESLSLLYLSNSFLQTSKKLKLLYSSTAENWNFESLHQTLLGYNGSTLMLFRHEENLEFAYDKTASKKNYVFGVFQYMSWADVTQNTKGSDETYFFSLAPGFKNFNSKKNYDNNYGKQFSVIMNSNSENVAGIGLGKTNDGKYRLWLDKFLNERSYWLPKDETFESGNLLEPFIQKFNIRLVEVWGLENSKELNYHHVLGYTNTVLDKPEDIHEIRREFNSSSPPKIQGGKQFEEDIKRYLERVMKEKPQNN